jgi:hypothetical protein
MEELKDGAKALSAELRERIAVHGFQWHPIK